MIELTGPTRSLAPGVKPEKLVVFLHGVGADGQDLIGLANNFSLNLRNTIFISPNAPFNYDMFPAGYQWFSLLNRDENVMYEGVEKALPILKNYIDKNLAKYSLSYTDLILIGFSQGTMMAIQLALRLDEPCFAVIGFSGALIKSKQLESAKKSTPPILLIHGNEDQVIPVQSHIYAVDQLRKMNLEIEDHIMLGLGHGINMEGINIANRFLANRIKQ